MELLLPRNSGRKRMSCREQSSFTNSSKRAPCSSMCPMTEMSEILLMESICQCASWVNKKT